MATLLFRFRRREAEPAEAARPLPRGPRPLPPRRGLHRRHEVHPDTQEGRQLKTINSLSNSLQGFLLNVTPVIVTKRLL